MEWSRWWRKRVGGAAALGVAVLVGIGLSARPAQAAFVEYLSQVGSNVVATGSGTLDLTDLTPSFVGTLNSTIYPLLGNITTGAESGVVLYSGITGPSNFGSGFGGTASSDSGDIVGIDSGYLVVPNLYTSGGLLSSTSTWDSTTLSGLGATDGTYVWTWGTGADADSYTLVITPEPSSVVLLSLGLLGLGFAARGRRQKQQTAV